MTVYLLLVNLIICQRSQFFSLSLSSFFTHLGFIQTFFFNIIVKEGSEKHDCNVCFASACFQINYVSILLAIRSAFLFPVVLYFLVNLHLIRERDQRSISWSRGRIVAPTFVFVLLSLKAVDADLVRFNCCALTENRWFIYWRHLPAWLLKIKISLNGRQGYFRLGRDMLLRLIDNGLIPLK